MSSGVLASVHTAFARVLTALSTCSTTSQTPVKFLLGLKSNGDANDEPGTENQIASIRSAISLFPHRFAPIFDSPRYTEEVFTCIFSRFRKVDKQDSQNAPDIDPECKEFYARVAHLPPGSRVVATRVDRIFRDSQAATELCGTISARDVILVFTDQDAEDGSKLNSRDHRKQIIGLAMEAQKPFADNVENALTQLCAAAFEGRPYGSQMQNPLDTPQVDFLTNAEKTQRLCAIMRQAREQFPDFPFGDVPKKLRVEVANFIACDLRHDAFALKDALDLSSTRKMMIPLAQEYLSVNNRSNRYWKEFAVRCVDFTIETEKTLLWQIRFHVARQMEPVFPNAHASHPIPKPRSRHELTKLLLDHPSYKKILDDRIDELKEVLDKKNAEEKAAQEAALGAASMEQ